MGAERVDAKARIALRKLVKSRLFLLYTLPYIQSATTIPATFFILISVAKTSLEAATYVALITLLANSAMLIVRYVVARKCLVFHFPWTSVYKYALGSAVMLMVLLAIPHPTGLSLTVASTLLRAATYFAILTFMDKETKLLVKSILQEAARILKFKGSVRA
ncbi:MAG: hypothetical protein JSV51_09515 [Candidatus Bathyarchaeota archaeon]|nr:MAG: hypothetical protein JSV51_09515 [Candidatus Bathyarchaeota archaeon]